MLAVMHTENGKSGSMLSTKRSTCIVCFCSCTSIGGVSYFGNSHNRFGAGEILLLKLLRLMREATEAIRQG
jgi:hypothetical protein